MFAGCQQLAGIGHQPNWPCQFHDNGCDNEHKIQDSHAQTQSFLQLPAANLDAHDRAKNHPKKQAGVEHQIGRFDWDTPEVWIARFDAALHQPGDWEPNLCQGATLDQIIVSF